MKRLWVMMTRSLLVGFLWAGMIGSGELHAQSVTTWHNDIGRTGQNPNETHLTQSNVTQNMFGRLCVNSALDGKIYAQPLVVTDVLFQGQTTRKTIAYVVTQNDSVYAIDATNCTIVSGRGGQKQLIPSGSGEGAVNCHHIPGNCLINPTVGILGTPVIEITGTNPTTGTLYAVAESECPGCGQGGTNVFYHRLWALDITNLSEANGGHVQICPSGCGKDLTGSAFSSAHIQRPGLLFLDSTKTKGDNMVYAAFSMMDGASGDPNGWIWAYNGHNLTTTPLSYETTDGVNGKRRGGIWQGGAGLMSAKDANGGYHIYFSTGDGDFDLDQPQSPNTDAADSFLKLRPDLGAQTVSPQPFYFTPADQFWRGCSNPFNDWDFGSGGTLAIPESTFSPPQFFALKADKGNYLWVMDRTSPGGYNGGGTNPNCGTGTPPQNCANKCLNPNNNTESFQFSTGSNCTGGACTARSTPAFWSGTVSSGDQGELYLAGTYDELKRYPVSSSCNPGPVCSAAAASTNVDPIGTTHLGYSATPSVSSSGTTLNTGVVWASSTWAEWARRSSTRLRRTT